MVAHIGCYETPTVMWEAEMREQDGGSQTSLPGEMQGQGHLGSLRSAGAQAPGQPGECRGAGTGAAWRIQQHNHRKDSLYLNKIGEADAGRSS